MYIILCLNVSYCFDKMKPIIYQLQSIHHSGWNQIEDVLGVKLMEVILNKDGLYYQKTMDEKRWICDLVTCNL